MRSSRLNFGSRGVVALEEEARRQEELENPAPETPVEDNANSLETDLIEAGEEQGDITEVTDAVEDGLDTVEALESLRESVGAAAKAGGLDQHGAAVARAALESMYARVGLSVSNPTPALESFGGVADKVRATVALEADIKGKAIAIFEKIKEAVKKAIAWVVDLFNRFFGAAEKLQKRAAGLEERANKLTGTPKENTFKNERLFGQLQIGGKVPAGAEGATALVTVYSEVFKNYPGFLDTLNGIADKAAGGKTDELIAAVKAQAGKLDLGLKKVANPGSLGYSVAEGGSMTQSQPLPGGVAMAIILDPTNVGNSTGGVLPVSRNAAAPKGDEVAVLKKGVIEKVAKDMSSLGGQLVHGRDIVKKMTDTKNKLIAHVDKAAKAAGNEAEGASLKASSDALRLTLKLIDAPFVAFNKYALDAGKALCDQIEESLKAHGGDAAPAADGKDKKEAAKK